MTQRSYSLAQGKKRRDVVIAAGSAIGTDAVRVLVDTANVDLGTGHANDNERKSEILKALSLIRERILQDTF